jgi:site-specific DNA-methyltransferase (adenine-specific)
MFGHEYSPRSKADQLYFTEDDVCGGCGQAHLERKKLENPSPAEAFVQAPKPEVLEEVGVSVEPSTTTISPPLLETTYINQILQGDSLIRLKELPDNSVDAVVTDPPYELGFMGKDWDKKGVAYNVVLWKEVLRVLKPGGHLLSFGGSRTYHRMACAIEDAGFEIRDMIDWVYGSGFPKSMDISKAIDKMKGTYVRGEISPNSRNSGESPSGCYSEGVQHKTIDTPQCEEAQEWFGWGTALKPAHEPIVLARKPLSEKTVAENVLKWGVGGLAIDNCRVNLNGDKPRIANTEESKTNTYGWAKGGIYKSGTMPAQGRFPANLIHDGSEEVLTEFAKAGESKSNPSNYNWERSKDASIPAGCAGGTIKSGVHFDDSGTPARFFYCAKASNVERWFYCSICKDAFPNKQRSEHKHEKPDDDQTHITSHPTQKPKALMEYLIKLLTREGQIVLDPFMGAGSTAVACVELDRKFIGFDLDDTYCEIARKRIANARKEVKSG